MSSKSFLRQKFGIRLIFPNLLMCLAHHVLCDFDYLNDYCVIVQITKLHVMLFSPLSCFVLLGDIILLHTPIFIVSFKCRYKVSCP
jgi:hypothetical protein